MTRRLSQFDRDTGEVIEDGYLAVLMPKRRNGFVKGWYAMSQEGTVALLEAMMSGSLQMRDVQVLYYLLSVLDFENLIQVPQTEIGEKLGMQRSHVNRSIKRLVELDILLEGPRIGRSRSYRLNPSYGWRGSAKGHQKALKARMEAAGMRVIEGGRDFAPDRDPNTLDMFGNETDPEKAE